jgi:outer membrane protein assembly factor BamB
MNAPLQSQNQATGSATNTSDLVFIGIRGSVVALHRATGRQAWVTHLKGSDFVNVALENDSLLATCYGEVFCLDPLTGDALWHNPLTGFVRGLATIATDHNPASALAPVLAEKRRRDEEAAAASSTAVMASA